MGDSITVAQILAATIPQVTITFILLLSFYVEFKKFKNKRATTTMLAAEFFITGGTVRPVRVGRFLLCHHCIVKCGIN